MSKQGLSYGLTLGKKSTSSKPAPAKRKPVFGADDSDDEPAPPSKSTSVIEIGGLEDDFAGANAPQSLPERKPKSKNGPPTKPSAPKSKAAPSAMFGDLASGLASRKYAEAAEQLDPNIYDYDAVYDSMKPAKKNKVEDEEKKPRYMTGLLAASEIRKRNQQIAEERKVAREREAEGDEFADKEKFVTSAYRKQQEENARLREEEKRKEEEEARKNKTGGMTAFYRELLDRGDRQHAETVKAAQEGPKSTGKEEDEPAEKEKTEADIAKEINERGGKVAMNEDGQIVDKRQLLRGGLNVAAKKKDQPKKETRDSRRGNGYNPDSGQGRGFVGAGGGKRGMVARQTKMMEEQLAATLKRSRDAEEEEKQKTVEAMTKSRKTDGDISSARERYLARKRAAEEEKKTAQAG